MLWTALSSCLLALPGLFQDSPLSPPLVLHAMPVVLRLSLPRLAGDALKKLETDVTAKPGDFDQALRLASTHVLMGQNQKGVDVLIKSIAQPEVNMTNLLLAAEFFNRIGDSKNLEAALVKLTEKVPDSPEGWFDLAGVQASNGSRAQDAWVTLAKALALDKQRRATNATADNLYERVQGDPRFTDVRRLPEFKAWQP